MRKPKLHRTYARVVSDLIPGIFRRFRIGSLRFPMHHQSGRERLVQDSFSIAVPFGYSSSSEGTPRAVAVVCHLFHSDLASWLLEALQRSGLSADLFISTNSGENAEIIRNVLSKWLGGLAEIRVVENRGRDIAPKLITFADVYDRYELVLFLHSKKSLHYEFGDEWRAYLMRSLAGSPEIVESIMEVFEHCPRIGMVIPQHFNKLRTKTKLAWGTNFRKARRLAWRMDIDLGPDGYLDMPSGSMFWARPAALRPLVNLDLDFQDFPPEPCPLDGTLAHAIERLFLFACEKAGYGWIKVTDAANDPTAVSVNAPTDIAQFIKQHEFNLLGPEGRHR